MAWRSLAETQGFASRLCSRFAVIESREDELRSDEPDTNGPRNPLGRKPLTVKDSTDAVKKKQGRNDEPRHVVESMFSQVAENQVHRKTDFRSKADRCHGHPETNAVNLRQRPYFRGDRGKSG